MFKGDQMVVHVSMYSSSELQKYIYGLEVIISPFNIKSKKKKKTIDPKKTCIKTLDLYRKKR